MLALGITQQYEPISPTTDFPEDAQQIYVVLKSDPAKSVSLRATWTAVNVEGLKPHHPLTDSRLSLAPGRRGAMWMKAPKGGFAPGDYRVDLVVEGNPAQSLPFKVIPLLPPAVLVDETDALRGFNIALAALGGKVELATSQWDAQRWAATNLIDGVSFLMEAKDNCASCGWASKDNTFPQELVFSFYQGWEALVTAVVIDTTS